MLIDHQQELYHKSLSELNFWLFVCVLLHFKIGLQIGRRLGGDSLVDNDYGHAQTYLKYEYDLIMPVQARYHSPPQYSTTIQYFK